MKIRHGLVLAMAILFGVAGCASGGGGGGGTSLADLAGGGGGESPRDTPNTRAAEAAVEAGDEADDPAESRMHYQEGLTSAEAAIAEDPTNPLAHRLAAQAALGLEDYQQAGQHFDRAAELRPLYEFEDQTVRERTWIELYQSATPLVQNGDYEGAAEAFEDANAIYAGRPEAMVTLGQIYAQLRRHDEAIENLDAALAFMESDQMAAVDSATAAGWRESAIELPLLRAQVLADAGRFEEAAGAYRSLSAADPGNVDLRMGLATILTQMGDEAEAQEVYDGLIDQPGLAGRDYYQIGIGFYSSNNYDGAIRAFSSAAEASPRDRDALEMWARSLREDSIFAQVPPVAERWLELDPNSQNGFLILAQAANVNGDNDTAREAVAAVEELSVAVDQLQLRTAGAGGGTVNGVVVNRSLDQGQTVTLRFTFYGTNNTPIGTVSQSVAVGAAGMNEVFTVEFDSAEQVAGYGYELTVG